VIGLTREVNEALEREKLQAPIRVAVMGCVVNGPVKRARPTSGSPPARGRASSSSRVR